MIRGIQYAWRGHRVRQAFANFVGIAVSIHTREVVSSTLKRHADRLLVLCSRKYEVVGGQETPFWATPSNLRLYLALGLGTFRVNRFVADTPPSRQEWSAMLIL